MVNTEGPDKLTESQMAEWLGTTYKGLQARRLKGQIPEGIWNRMGPKLIYYSKSRYESWQESQWHSPPELTYTENPYESASPGKVSATQKSSLTRQRMHPASHGQQSFVLK